MLGGVEVTARTRAHAAEMIDRAGRLARRRLLLRPHVEHEAVLLDVVAVPIRDLALQLLDALVVELRHSAGLETHHVIVVRAVRELEDGLCRLRSCGG